MSMSPVDRRVGVLVHGHSPDGVTIHLIVNPSGDSPAASSMVTHQSTGE